MPRNPSPYPERHTPSLLSSRVLPGCTSSSAQSYTPICIVSPSTSQYFFLFSVFLLYCFCAFLTFPSVSHQPPWAICLPTLLFFKVQLFLLLMMLLILWLQSCITFEGSVGLYLLLFPP